MEIGEIIKKISGESGVSEDQIKERIEKKQKELGGLITAEGAAHIIANEVGIDLFEISQRPGLKIESIIPGMDKVDVVGRVIKIYQPREFERDDGSKGKVCNLVLGDETGTIRTVFWDKGVDFVQREIKEGYILRIRNGYTKENINGEAEVHIGARAKVIPNPKDIKKEDVPLPESNKKISELKEGMNRVNVVCKILRIFEPREFEREENEKGKVANLIVGDETGKARLVLWDEDVGLVEKRKLRKGDIIKVKKGYVKERFGEPEINVGRYGKIILNPEEKIEVEFEIPRKEMAGLKAGDRAEIRAALLELYDLRVFDKKNGKGMVINGILDDGTASMRAAFYDKTAEALLNIPLKKALETDVSKDISERKKKLLGKEIIALVRVKHSDFSGRDELVVEDIDLNPDPVKEAEALLKEAKLIEPKGG